MPMDDLVRRRLASQRLVGEGFATPGESVASMGAVQSQDVPGATWAVGLRTHDATAASVQAAFDAGDFVRTHVLRPTWHFVGAADSRWIMALSGPRVQALNAGRYLQLELDQGTLVRGAEIMTGALADGVFLTRTELGAVLRQHGIVTDGQRLAYLSMYAELEALICSGPARGKQHTYALFDERIPPSAPRSRDEALAGLAERFFVSHGPATAHDFAWWTSFTVADARKAADLAAARLERTEFEGRTWWSGAIDAVPVPAHHALLLPNYDEYFSQDGFSRQFSMADPERMPELLAAGRVDAHHLVIDGLLRGGWRRRIAGTTTHLEIDPWTSLSDSERRAVAGETARYGQFLGQEPVVTWTSG
jgi:hypothetical protein